MFLNSTLIWQRIVS